MAEEFKFRGHKVRVVEERVSAERREANLFYYEIRGSDEDFGTPATVEPGVMVNFWGTVISEDEISELKVHGDYLELTEKERSDFYDHAE